MLYNNKLSLTVCSSSKHNEIIINFNCCDLNLNSIAIKTGIEKAYLLNIDNSNHLISRSIKYIPSINKNINQQPIYCKTKYDQYLYNKKKKLAWKQMMNNALSYIYHMRFYIKGYYPILKTINIKELNIRNRKMNRHINCSSSSSNNSYELENYTKVGKFKINNDSEDDNNS